jgi:hypothetical protein
MKAIQRFAAMHPLVFIFLAALAWIVPGLAAAYPGLIGFQPRSLRRHHAGRKAGAGAVR